MDNKAIGLLISTRRKEKGLTQKALAEQLNVTDKAVSKWERDIAKPDINTIPKLAEILDLSIEELMNLPVKPKVEAVPNQDEIDIDPIFPEKKDAFTHDLGATERAFYKGKVKGLIIKGLLGFIGGAILYLCTSKNHDFKSAALMGLFLSGVPYGWELMGRVLGDLVVVGHIAIMLIVFVIRFCLSVFIGWFTYPIALVYNLMKTQKVGSVSRLILTAILVIVVILIVSFIYLLAQPLSSIPSMFAT